MARKLLDSPAAIAARERTAQNKGYDSYAAWQESKQRKIDTERQYVITDLASQEEERRNHEQKKKAEAAERSGHDLQFPGEVLETGQPAATLIDELKSLLLWAEALKLEKPWVTVEQTTTRDVARRVWHEWKRLGFPLFNPYSRALSENWAAETPPASFEIGWAHQEGADDPITAGMLGFAGYQEDPIASESVAPRPQSNSIDGIEKTSSFKDDAGRVYQARFPKSEL